MRGASPTDEPPKARARAKQPIRERVWALLGERRVARFPGARGRIPNFAGAEAAARQLAESPAWRAATAVKCNPDAPQLPVRVLALRQGKRLFMAVPRLRQARCFLELDPRRFAGRERSAASIRGASVYGVPTLPKDMPRIDLIVAGSVAVDRRGARVGKGGGFSDIEFALLTELGLVGAWTTVATTVHPLQIVRAAIPMLAHDIPLDLIATPDGTIACPRHHTRPRGILWADLPDEKIAAIPVLARLARARGR
jgi:5-formyltetrahydrofolate cyclo-ligase